MASDPTYPYEGGIVRPSVNLEEAQQLSWPFLVSLGWNRSSHDLETYMKASRSKGLLLAVPKGTSQPKGHVMATIYDNSTGWVTLFVVDQSHRGKGHGRALFSAAMREFFLHSTSIIGLDGVSMQKETYERRGFVESPFGRIKCVTRRLLNDNDIIIPLGNEEKLVDITSISPSLLQQIDFAQTGFQRSGLWTPSFFARPDVFGYALIENQGGLARDVPNVLAWVVVRRSSAGFRFGPVYGRDKGSVQKVLLAGMRTATPVVISRVRLEGEQENEKKVNKKQDDESHYSLTAEIWSGNPTAMETFEELGWKWAGVDYHRMWLHGKATKQQAEGGLAHKEMYAVFDAAIG